MVISVSEQLRLLLMKRIKSMKPEERLPTERDLAKEYGVSRDTVRRVLKEFLIQGLLYASPRLGYVRLPDPKEGANTSLLLGNNCVGLIIPVTSGLSTFYSRLFLGFAEGIRAAGYNYISHGSHSVVEERKMIDDMSKKGVLGIAINFIPGRKGNQSVELLKRTKLAFIALENYPVGSHIDHVVSDEDKSMEMAVNYLFNRGHRNIAYVTYGIGYSLSSLSDRKLSFQKILATRGFSLSQIDACVINTAPERLLSVISDNYKQRRNAPTGLCCEGWMTERLIYCLNSNGIKVPKDVEVVAVTSEPSAVHLPAVITDTYKIGRVAAEELISMIKEKGGKKVNIKVPPLDALQQANN